MRRVISKKKTEYMAQERINFVYGDEKKGILGCIKSGIEEDIANRIFDDMVDFAKYAFNKSHAAIYTITSLYTGYLKTYYPNEFYAAIFKYAMDIDELGEFIADAKAYNVDGKTIQILPPSVNHSECNFSVTKEGVRFGLNNIKGFGIDASRAICEERKNGSFKNFHDFILRCKCSETDLSKLIYAGAFDEFGHSRESLLLTLQYLPSFLDVIKKKSIYIEECKDIIEKINTGEYKSVSDLKKYSQFKITSKSNVLNLGNIQTRLKTAEESLNSATKDFLDISVDYVSISEERATELLEEENRLLGFYISKHPIQNYEVYTKSIANLTKEDTEASGIISDLKSTNGHLFFNLTDTTGQVRCVIWSKNAKNFNIKNGQAIHISEKIKVNTYNDAESLQFVLDKPKSITPLKRRKSTFLLKVNSVIELMDLLPEIEMFRTTEKDDNASILKVYDNLLCEFRQLNYFVVPNIINSEKLNLSEL